MKKYTSIVVYALFVILTISVSAQSSVSSDIYIKAGEKSKKDISSVSGDISIGKHAKILGSVKTVSGDVEIGAKASTGHVTTVSGDVSVGKGSASEGVKTVSGDIHLFGQNEIQGSINTVSGDIHCKTGSDIRANLTTVSGDIELDDSRLRGYLKTVSGDIALFNGAVIDGDIIINRTANRGFGNMGTLKVIIDLNSVVKGSIKVKEPNTNVFVYLSNGGKVVGDIVNAEVREK